LDTDRILDSAYVSKGTLSLNGKIIQPEKLMLTATDLLSKEYIYTFLLIGNENVRFSAKKLDFPWNIDISGSGIQDIAEKFNHVMYQKQSITKHLKEVFVNDREQLVQRYNQVSDSLDNVTIELIKENFNSYAALDNLKYHKTQFSRGELANLYTKLSPELKQSKRGTAIKTQIEYPIANVGDAYYDYTALNQYGNTISLSDIKEKYILLHFSSLSCTYSQRALPELRSLYNRYKDKLEIVKISQDLNGDGWKKSIKRDSITWINLWDGKAEYGDAVIKYGSIGSPYFILISPKKMILEKWSGHGYGIFKEKLDKHLKP
jgi:peroxiredoxin